MAGKPNPEALKKINKILDDTIRPAIMADGGDLQVTAIEGNRIYIKYEGACHGCPMAKLGTLQAIQSVLREEYDPNCEVIAEDE